MRQPLDPRNSCEKRTNIWLLLLPKTIQFITNLLILASKLIHCGCRAQSENFHLRREEKRPPIGWDDAWPRIGNSAAREVILVGQVVYASFELEPAVLPGKGQIEKLVGWNRAYYGREAAIGGIGGIGELFG